jgi:ketosteroid isomerase-like protein
MERLRRLRLLSHAADRDFSQPYKLSATQAPLIVGAFTSQVIVKRAKDGLIRAAYGSAYSAKPKDFLARRKNSMSAKEEIDRLNEEIASAAAKGDFAPFLHALDDDAKIFDHVPYRFDSKQEFVEYLRGATAGAESVSYVFHQPSCRVINEATAILNSYDRLTLVSKAGGGTAGTVRASNSRLQQTRPGLEDCCRALLSSAERLTLCSGSRTNVREPERGGSK